MEIVSIVESTQSLYKLLFEDDGDDKESNDALKVCKQQGYQNHSVTRLQSITVTSNQWHHSVNNLFVGYKFLNTLQMWGHKWRRGWGIYGHVMHLPAGPGDFRTRWHWLYKCVIIPKITYAVVAWWDIMDITLARSKLECLPRAVCIIITGTMRTIPTKVLEMLLYPPPLGTACGVCSLDGSTLPTEARSKKSRNRT